MVLITTRVLVHHTNIIAVLIAVQSSNIAIKHIIKGQVSFDIENQIVGNLQEEGLVLLRGPIGLQQGTRHRS